MIEQTGWIGVDLDGTLAYHEPHSGDGELGSPLWPMVDLVWQYLNDGYEVRVFTARITLADELLQLSATQDLIQDWLENECGLPRLRCTCIKDFEMLVLYDDRAVQVVHNEGTIA